MKLVGNKIAPPKFKVGDVVTLTKEPGWLYRIDLVKSSLISHRIEGEIIGVPKGQEKWLRGWFSGPVEMYEGVEQ